MLFQLLEHLRHLAQPRELEDLVRLYIQGLWWPRVQRASRLRDCSVHQSRVQQLHCARQCVQDASSDHSIHQPRGPSETRPSWWVLIHLLRSLKCHRGADTCHTELVVIDEAAAIPLPIVKNLLGPYLVFMASTINGYEGTGRSLSLKLIKQLREQSGSSQGNAALGGTS